MASTCLVHPVYLTKRLSVVKASHECNAGRVNVYAAGLMLSVDAKSPVQQASPLYK